VQKVGLAVADWMVNYGVVREGGDGSSPFNREAPGAGSDPPTCRPYVHPHRCRLRLVLIDFLIVAAALVVVVLVLVALVLVAGVVAIVIAMVIISSPSSPCWCSC